jgi:hypothetical protein
MDKYVCRAFVYFILFHVAKKRDVLSKLLIASHIIFYFVGIRRFFWGFFYTTKLFTRLCGEGVSILLIHSTHLHDRIILLRGDVWDKKTSYYWSVCSKPRRIAVIYICVFPHRFVTYVFAYDFPIEFWNCFLPTIYLLNFVIVMTVWYVFHIIFLPKNICLVHCYINSLIQ